MPGSDAEEDAPDQEGHVPNVEVPEQWLPVDGLRRLDGSDRYERFGDNQCAALQSKRRGLLGANIHAAAALGSREYPRSNPPSLERHLIAPVALTPPNRPLGGWSWSPRCGRSLL